MKKILSTIIFVLLFCLSGFAQNTNSQCPTITILGPSSVVQPDEIMFFTATINGEVKNYKTKYKWTVDKGTIIEGQGTTVIRVSTEGLSDTTVTANFEIEGLPKDCINNDSETGVIVGLPIGEPYDTYGKLSIYDELARFDSFLLAIYGNGSEYYGFIVIYIKEKEISALTKKRLKMLAENLDRRKFSRERIIFAIGKSGKDYTYLWIVPPGAELPKCEGCKIIKGSDL